MRRIVSSVLAIFCCMLYMTACGQFLTDKSESSESSYANDSVAEFFEEVDNNNVSAAKTIYRDEINGNTDLESEVYSILLSRLETTIDNYNNANISDTEATMVFDTISALNVLHDNDVTPLQGTLNQLIVSKSAFESAESFFSTGDYYNAYQQYMLVISDDINYSTAISNATTAADEYVADVIEQAETSRANQDYIYAINIVRDTLAIMPNNQSLITEQTTLETEYLEFTLSNAETTYQEGRNYEGALEYVRSALTVLDDPSLYEALDYYTSCAPVPLSNLTYTQRAEYVVVGSDDYSYISQDVATDVNGNTYEANTIIHATGGGLGGDVAETDDESYVLYNLNFEYATFSGVIYRPYESLSCTDTWETPTVIMIYGDDVLLYEAPNITQDTWDSIEFSIDVTGVRNLKIVIRGIWTSGTGWIGLYDRHPKVCLAELYLQR